MVTDYEKEFKEFFDIDKTFRPLESRFSELKDKPKPIYKTGLNFLDEPLRGIMESETFLIGADSGYGKTELASIISYNVALQGIKTLLIALECYDGEMEDRRKFPIIQKMAYERLGKIIYQKDWVCGKYPELVELEQEIKLDEKIMGNMLIRYRQRGEDYTIKTLQDDLEKVLARKDIKFVVIDHIHHFDMDNVYSENIEMKNLIKKICNMSQIYHIPIVCFGQFKKRIGGSDTLVPDYDEFFGTSELYKNVSAVITVAPDFEAESEPHEFPTLFRICKARGGTQLKKYALGTIYSAETRNYERDYSLYLLKKGGTKKEDVSKKPSWCINYKLPRISSDKLSYSGCKD
jgi:hypothetical protein